MPTTTPQRPQYAEFDEYIDFQLQRARKGIRTIDVITALCGVGVMVLSYLLVFVALDHWVVTGGFSYGWRVFLLSLLLIGTVAWIGWKVVLPYFRTVSQMYAAQTIEGASPELNSNLLNWVDLKQAGREVSPLILRSIEKRAAVTLSHSDLEEVVDRRPLLHWLYALVAVVAAFGLYMGLSPKKVGPSIWRALLPASEIQVATLTQIYRVDPPGTEIPARTHLEVTVDLLGDTPSAVSLRYTTEDRRFVDQPVEMRIVDSELKRYRCTLTGENNEGLLQDIDFWVIAGDAQSSSYHVTVTQPPSATPQDVTYDFPAYTKLARETQTGGNVDTLEGTEITIRATTNMPVKAARLQFSDDEKFSSKGEEQRGTISEGTRLSSSWKAKFRDDGSFPKFFRIQVETANGRSDPSPLVQTILLRRDQAPVIELIAPKTDLEVPVNAIIPVVVKARDPDFLLRDIALFAEIENTQVFHKLLSERSESSSEVRFDWKLSELKLKPGDVLTLRIEARDNKEPFANRTVSVKRLLRIANPISDKEAQEKLADDKQKIDDEQRATEDTNKGGDENSPRKEGTDSADKPDETDPDAKQPEDGKSGDGDKKSGDEKSGDSKAEGDQGDGKTSKSGDKTGDKTGDGKSGDSKTGEKKSNDPSNNSGEKSDGSKNADGKQSAKNNGEDDKEVLEKLIEKQQRDAQQNADKKSEDRKMEDRKNENQKSDGNDPDVASKPGDSKKGSEKKPPMSDSTGKPEPSKPESSASDSKPEDQKPTLGDSKPNKDPKDKTGSTEKPDPSAKPDSNEKTNDASTPGDDPKSGTSPDEKSPMKDDSKTGESSKKEPGKGDASDTSNPDKNPSAKPSDKSSDTDSKNPGNDAKSPNPKDEDPKSETQPAKSKDPSKDDASSPSKQPGQPSDKSGDPKPGDSKPATKKPDDKSSGASKPATEKPNSPPSKTDKPDPSQKPDAADKKPGDSKSGDSKPGDSKPGDSKSGDSKSGDSKSGDSKSGDSKSGDSKSGDSKPGDSQPGDQPDADSKDPSADNKSDKPESGKPDDKAAKKSGEKTQPDGGQKGGEQGQPKSGDAKSGEEQGGKGKSGKGKSAGSGESAEGGDQGSGTGKGSGKSGKGAKSLESGPGSQSDGQEPRGNGSAEGADSPESKADEPNLEDKRKATNLVLKKLKEELERGEVDDELLKQLGWTPDDMKRFVDRLDKQAQSQKSDSPAEQARRRQFEEMLKSLDLKSSGTRRDDKNQTKRSTSDFSDKRAPVPLEYKDALERYSKEVAKQKKPAK